MEASAPVVHPHAVPSEVSGIPFQPRGGAGVVSELLSSLFYFRGMFEVRELSLL